MAQQLQFRRGTTAEHLTFVGASGELTYDSDRKTMVAHNGTQPGGFPMQREMVIDISVWGAVPSTDGDPQTMTNNVVAIQKALDDAQIIGKPVYVPPGNFQINDSLKIPNGVQIFGAGMGTSIIDGSLLVDSDSIDLAVMKAIGPEAQP
ncbi:MAG: hypothetical protein HQL54_12060, partial [Magnetococcales bacterium]|nr:hypothetical protein [Magnetococcales bacterium]